MPVNTAPNSGKFKKGQSGNPRGKPKGARHKTTQALQIMLNGEAEALTRKAIDMALTGDMAALKLCMDRICPPLKSQAQCIEIQDIKSNNLTDTATRILTEITNGNIAPDIGSQLISSLAVIARTEELEQMKERVEALEIALKGR